MLELANNYYKHSERCPKAGVRKILFKGSNDSGVGEILESEASSFNTNLRVVTILRNVLEFIKAKVRNRPPCYQFVDVFTSHIPGAFHANFINGTLIVILENSVEKFYFKDSDGYEALYRAMKRPLMEIERISEELIIVRDARYDTLAYIRECPELFNAIANEIEKLDDALCKNSDIEHFLSIEYKAIQLASHYKKEADSKLLGYLEIAATLQKEVEKIGARICHGDLWVGNILALSDGRVVLVDYDKSVRYCEAYDYVYYYLMTHRVGGAREVQTVLTTLEETSNEISRFLKEAAFELSQEFSIQAIRLSILLFALLKLLEKDLWRNTLGASIPIIHQAMGCRPSDDSTG